MTGKISKIDEYERSMGFQLKFKSEKHMIITSLVWKWSKRNGDEVELFSEKRKIIEREKYWNVLGEFIAKDKTLKIIKIYTDIYGEEDEMFENRVMKQIPDNIQIFLVDCDKGNNYLKEWVLKYNIVYLKTGSKDLLQNVVHHRNLKCVSFNEGTENLSECDFLFTKKADHLDALTISCKDNNENKIKSFIKIAGDLDLYPGGININNKNECTKLNSKRNQDKGLVKRVFESRENYEFGETNYKTLVDVILESESYDDVNGYIYLTFKECSQKLNFKESEVRSIIEFDSRNDQNLKVVIRGEHNRICYIKERKLPIDII